MYLAYNALLGTNPEVHKTSCIIIFVFHILPGESSIVARVRYYHMFHKSPTALLTIINNGTNNEIMEQSLKLSAASIFITVTFFHY